MERKKQQKEKNAATIGGLFVLLAIIGAITIVVLGIRLTTQLLDNQKQKSEFESILQPVVMFDPVPFSDPAEIDQNSLHLYSMWTILSNDKVKDYERSEESQSLKIPASDLEAAAFQLFGDRVTIEHGTFSDNQTTYFYDQKNNVYEVPTYGFFYVFKPEVDDVKKIDKGVYRVLVRYIPPNNAWGSIYAGATSDGGFSNKSMYFIMGRISNGWNLLRIEEVPQEEAINQYPDSSPSSAIESIANSEEQTSTSEAPPVSTTEPSSKETSEISAESSISSKEESSEQETSVDDSSDDTSDGDESSDSSSEISATASIDDDSN